MGVGDGDWSGGRGELGGGVGDGEWTDGKRE